MPDGESTRAMTRGGTSQSSAFWLGFLTVALLLGACLRSVWPLDIEYKFDEAFVVEGVRRGGWPKPFPRLGMISGAGIRNPGMGLWVFLALGRLFHAQSPPELARGVQYMNVLALFALFYLALDVVEPVHRRTWQWAGAFAAVNPFAVLLHRKIWAQSTLPLFCVLLLLGWYRRERWWGAFLWGFVGICMGQIHMSGFFLALGVLVWTAAFGRQCVTIRPTSWPAWAMGSLLGLLPLVPWCTYLLTESRISLWDSLFGIGRGPLIGSSFWQLWTADALGLGLWDHLGYAEFRAFLHYPLVGGQSSYAVALMHVILVSLGACALVNSARTLWKEEGRWKEGLVGSGSETALIRNAVLVGFGIALSLSGVAIYRHYLLVSFPLEWVWLVGVVEKGAHRSQRILGLLWSAQFFISVALLWYIHVNHGALTGDFGMSYGFQVP
jgi:hypothetical protein